MFVLVGVILHMQERKICSHSLNMFKNMKIKSKKIIYIFQQHNMPNLEDIGKGTLVDLHISRIYQCNLQKVIHINHQALMSSRIVEEVLGHMQVEVLGYMRVEVLGHSSENFRRIKLKSLLTGGA